MNNNRRIWMGKGLAWWAKMLATALFLGWWMRGWLNAMKNW